MLRIRPLDIITGAMLIGGVCGYEIARNDVVGKVQRKLALAADERAKRNAQITMDVWASKAEVTSGSTQA
jgi:hypothetical protein